MATLLKEQVVIPTEKSRRGGPIYEFLSKDHRRLESLLDLATQDSPVIDREAYTKFRAGLLRHISMEEKILLPAVRNAGGGAPLPIEGQIRLDHGAIASLLVPPPLPQVIGALRAILAVHDDLEECTAGMYDLCDSVIGTTANELIARLRETPEVPIDPGVDNPHALDATRRALARAGYNFDDYRE